MNVGRRVVGVALMLGFVAWPAAPAAATSGTVRERTWVEIRAAVHPTGGGTIAYDPLRHQSVLFVNGASPQTWVFDAGTRTWTKKSPPHEPNVAGGAMAFDAAHGDIVLLANTPGQQYCDNYAATETWTWNGTDWIHVQPATTPLGCFGGQLVYDAKRARVLAVSSEFNPRGWSWNGTDWTELTNPPFTWGTSAAYNPEAGKVLVFGGDYFWHGWNDLGNTTYWDGTQTTLVDPGGGRYDPHPRTFATLFYDRLVGSVIMFGGISRNYTGDITNQWNDTWRWNGSHWFRMGTQASPPPGTTGVATYDVDHNVGVMYSSGRTFLWTAAKAGGGYAQTNSFGKVAVVGDARFIGDASTTQLSQPVVGIARTPTRKGYWLVARDGGIFSYGDARFFGSTGRIHLNRPIVGMAATPSGQGYWLVAADGGIFTFGDARFFGSTGAIHLNQPIVGMATTPTGDGYWLVARDGGVFAFGKARYFGSTGATRLNQPIVGMATTPTGDGYWLVARDGGIFTYGDAKFAGSQPGPDPVVAMSASPTGNGYWVFHTDGRTDRFGDAQAHGKPAITFAVGAYAT